MPTYSKSDANNKMRKVSFFQDSSFMNSPDERLQYKEAGLYLFLPDVSFFFPMQKNGKVL